MTDSMKFGPEWLRNMSADPTVNANNNNNNNFQHHGHNNSNNSSSNVGGNITPPTRNMFPEFRYGREEMLALFEKNCTQLPEILPAFKSIYVEKVQYPLALTPSNDDELVTSPVPPTLGRSSWLQRSPIGFAGGSGGVGSVRGGSMSRAPSMGGSSSFDRGRGRGKANFSMYSSRTTANPNNYDESGGAPTVGLIKERSWNERNGVSSADGGTNCGSLNTDWNITPNSSPRKEYSSQSRNIENWRKNRDDLQPSIDNASTAGSGVSSGAASGENANGGSNNILNMDSSSSGWRSNALGSSTSYRWSRSTSWRDEDALSTTTPSTNATSSNIFDNDSGNSTSAFNNHTMHRSFSSISTDRGGNRLPTTTLSQKNDNIQNGNEKEHHSQQQLPEWATENTLVGGTFDASGAFHGNNEIQQEQQQKIMENEQENDDSEGKKSEEKKYDKNEAMKTTTTTNGTNNDTDIMYKTVTNDMIEKLIMEPTTLTKTPLATSTTVTTTIVNNNYQYSHQQQQDSLPTTTSTTTQSSINTTSTVTSDSTDLWFYRDPQLAIQGPFNAIEMLEWYRAGYFNEHLYVRRVCDQRFRTLGELIKLCHGQIPFTNGNLLNMVLTPRETITPQLINDDELQQQHLLSIHQQQYVTHPQQQQQHFDLKLDITAAADSLGAAVKNMNAHEMSQMLNLHFQMLQKQYQRHQEMIIITELSNNECFQRLLPNEKEAVVRQKVLSLGIPDYLTNLTGLSTSLATHNPIAGNELYHKLSECTKKTSATTNIVNQSQSISQSQTHDQYQHFNNIEQQQQFMQMWGNNDLIQQQQQQLLSLPQQRQQGDNPWSSTIQTKQHQQQQQQQQHVAQILSVSDLEQQQQQQHAILNNIWQLPTPPQQQQQQQQIDPDNTTFTQTTDNVDVTLQPATAPVSQPPTTLSAIEAQIIAKQQQQQQQKQQIKNQQVVAAVAASTTKFNQQKQQTQRNNNNNNNKVKQQKTNSTINADNKKQQQQLQQQQQQQTQQQIKQQQQQKDEQQQRQRKLLQQQKAEAEEKERQQLIQQQRRKALTSASTTTSAPITEIKETPKTNHNIIKSSVAPWSSTNLGGDTALGSGIQNCSGSGITGAQSLSLAEIQKSERREQRLRMEQQQRQLELLQQQQREQQQQHQQQQNQSNQHIFIDGWNAQQTIAVKSLAEIQAEEAKRLALYEQQRKQELLEQQHQQQQQTMLMFEQQQQQMHNNNTTTTTASALFNTNNVWQQSTTQQQQLTAAAVLAAGLPTLQQQQKMIIKKSQTVSTMQQHQTMATTISKQQQQQQQMVNKNPNKNSSSSSTAAIANRTKSDTNINNKIKPSTSNTNNNNNKEQQKSNITPSGGVNNNDLDMEFTAWCTRSLNNMQAKVDVPTFVTFLQDLESPFEIKDYIRMYLGESKEYVDFAKQFLEKRSKCRSLQRAKNAHNDDMCMPAPAITPSSNDNSEKSKQKKTKKNKMMKLDARILGFSVTAAAGRINVGDRDYVDAP